MLWTSNLKTYDVINLQSFIGRWKVQFILFVNVANDCGSFLVGAFLLACTNALGWTTPLLLTFIFTYFYISQKHICIISLTVLS